MLTTLLALALPALADQPLLYSGDAGEAVERVSAATGEPAWSFDPLRPSELVDGDMPALLGAPTPCAPAAVATNAELRAVADRAQLRLQRQDWAGARADLVAAQGLLSCLSEEADAERAAQVFLMLGVVAWAEGREADARTAFDRAHRFRLDASGASQLAWDDRLAAPDRGGAAFDAAGKDLASAPKGAIGVAPGVDATRASLRIDGRTVTPQAGERIELPVGYHHVQLLTPAGVRTVEVAVRESPPLLLVDPKGLESLQLEAHVGTEPMAMLLGAARPSTETAFAATPDALWRLDGADWSALPAVDPGAGQRRARSASAMRASGYTAVAVGLTTAAIGFLQFAQVAQPPSWESTVEMAEWRDGQARTWRGLGVGGAGLAVGGGVLAGIGHARAR